jgi:hypothetical protein
MGMISNRVYFTGELPTIETFIKRLEQLTGEKIVSENLEDEKGLFGINLSSNKSNGSFDLLLMTEALGYEAYCVMGGPHYLLDATVMVLQALGGTCE